MANTLNKALLIGHLGKDAELKYSNQGLAILSFTVATNYNMKDKDGNWKSETTWHDVKCFRDMAERYKDLLKKGKKVYVEGRINKSSYVDREQIKRWSIDIIADQIILLERADTEVSFNETKDEVSFDDHINQSIGNTSAPEEDLPF